MFTFPAARYWLPNMFTLASMLCGLVIIWLSATAQEARDFYLAALLIPTACVLDGFDGRVARWVRGQSAIGVQMDSMSDLITFGVAPAFLLYFWAFQDLGFAGLFVSFIYVAGAMLRLARFNVQAEIDQGLSRYFNGLPTPMGAMGVAALVCLDVQVLGRETLPENAVPGVVVAAILLGLIMVSNIPFRTFKDLRRTPRDLLFVGSVMAALAIVVARTDILTGLSAIFTGYFASNLVFALIKRGWRTQESGAPSLEGEEDDNEEEIQRHV